MFTFFVGDADRSGRTAPTRVFLASVEVLTRKGLNSVRNKTNPPRLLVQPHIDKILSPENLSNWTTIRLPKILKETLR